MFSIKLYNKIFLLCIVKIRYCCKPVKRPRTPLGSVVATKRGFGQMVI